MEKIKQHKTVTFYSYTGGVGRSTTLANVAWLLATQLGKKVVVVDMNLESPGLHRFFGMEDKDTQTPGMMNLLLDFKELLRNEVEGDLEDNIDIVGEYLVDISLGECETGSLKLLSAGTLGKGFDKKVSSFDWSDFYEHWHGYGIMEFIKSKLEEHVDYVLIDSQVGVGDLAGISVRQLAELVIMCFPYNMKSIEGTKGVATSVSKMDGDLVPPKIMLLPSCIDITRPESKQYWERVAHSELETFIDNADENYLVTNLIRYMSRLSFGELLAVKEFPGHDVAQDYERLAHKIVDTLDKERNK